MNVKFKKKRRSSTGRTVYVFGIGHAKDEQPPITMMRAEIERLRLGNLVEMETETVRSDYQETEVEIYTTSPLSILVAGLESIINCITLAEEADRSTNSSAEFYRALNNEQAGYTMCRIVRRRLCATVDDLVKTLGSRYLWEASDRSDFQDELELALEKLAAFDRETNGIYEK